MRLLAVLGTIFLAVPALAQQPPADPPPASGSQFAPTNKDALKYRSGLAVPRFASLRSSRAYLRSGPGKEYPVLFVFVRPGTPLEVLAEWNVWRRVRDSDGTEGWMDRAMLSTDRTIQITGTTRDLRARPDLASPVVLRAEPGVIMRVTMCAEKWCRVEGEGRSGYLPRDQAFGVYPDESIG